MVVDDAGHRQLARARSPADRVAALQHLHVDAVTGEVDRGGQTVGPGADDDRLRHRPSASGALRGDVDGELVAGLGPRLAGQHIREVDVAGLDQAGLRVEGARTLPPGRGPYVFQDYGDAL